MGRVQKDGLIRQKLFDTKAAALAWEAEQRAADWTTPTVSLTVHEWATQYLDYVKVAQASKTYKEKRAAFKRLLGAVGPETPVEELTPSMVFAHLQAQAKIRSGNAANKDRKNLAAGWEWGTKYCKPKPLPRPNPCRVDKFPSVEQERYVPPPADFWAVYDVAEGQDKVMLAVFLYLAARRGEVFRLKWSDVDFATETVRLATRKRKDGSLEYDRLPMVQELKRLLLDWWEDRPFKDSPYVFVCDHDSVACRPYYGQPFKRRVHFMARMCERAGVKKFGFHAIRHLTPTVLYHLGVEVAVIQRIMRHKSPVTTARYLKKLIGNEIVRPALEKIRRPAKVIPLREDQPPKAAASEG